MNHEATEKEYKDLVEAVTRNFASISTKVRDLCDSNDLIESLQLLEKMRLEKTVLFHQYSTMNEFGEIDYSEDLKITKNELEQIVEEIEETLYEIKTQSLL